MFNRCFIALLVLFTSACQKNQDDNDTINTVSDDTSHAVIDSGNVDTLVSDVLTATVIGISSVVDPYITVSEDTPTTLRGESSGCLMGRSIFNLEKIDERNIKGVNEYSNYDNCLFYRLNGITNIEGTVSRNRIEYLEFDFTNLSLLNTALDSADVLTGNMRLVWKPSIAGSSEYTLTMNTHLNHSNNQKVLILDNFIIESIISAGMQSILISGRVYNPEIGYVFVDSSNPIVIHIPSQSFTSGQYTMTGRSEITTVIYASGNYETEILIR